MYIHTHVTVPAFQPAGFHVDKRGKKVGCSTNPQIQIFSSVLNYAVIHCLEQDKYPSYKGTIPEIRKKGQRFSK